LYLLWSLLSGNDVRAIATGRKKLVQGAIARDPPVCLRPKTRPSWCVLLMSAALVLANTGLDRVRAMVRAGTSENTERAYGQARADFAAYLQRLGIQVSEDNAIPIVLAYLGDMRDRALSHATANLRILAIAHLFEADLLRCNAIKVALRGYKNQDILAGKRQKQAKPCTADLLRLMVDAIDTTEPQGLRDRALLLVSFAAAMRRSEIAALSLVDLAFREDGVILTLPRSKTDQGGIGRTIEVFPGTSLCPIAALSAWIALLPSDGRVFRSIDKHGRIGASLSDRAIGQIWAMRGENAGITGLSGHSARVGFVWEAARNGASILEIQSTTGHKSLGSVQRYSGDALQLRGNNPLKGSL